MLSCYQSAFDLTYVNDKGEEVNAVSMVSETEGSVRLNVRLFWLEEPAVVRSFDLPVPLVSPIRYKEDCGVFGHIIRLPNSKVSRFCHPTLCCRFAEELAANPRTAPARFLYSKPSDWVFHWESWYDRVYRATNDTIQKIMSANTAPTTNFVYSSFRRGISNIITPNDGRVRPSGSWSENAQNGQSEAYSGLPICTDDILIRQYTDVRVGYVSVPGNDELYEKIKLAYLRVLDEGLEVIL